MPSPEVHDDRPPVALPSDDGKAVSRQRAIFRFAPSPNGRLHKGHAFSALLNEKLTRESGGRLLLRIEDVDRQRSRPEFEAGIIDDLAWLGIRFDGAPRRQSDHAADHQAALDRLLALGVAYRSAVSRSAIAAFALADPGWPRDPDGAPHPPPRGTAENEAIASQPHAIRLDMAAALRKTGRIAQWRDAAGLVEADAADWGDVVLKGRDGSFAYHLAVIVDDALQGVSHVVRGRDLFAATAVHRILQQLLGLAAPVYRHHDLLLDGEGQKLAKSRHAPSLRDLRASGMDAASLRAELGFD
jgi:glutamyl-Q tRNA(Asp) synthetase